MSPLEGLFDYMVTNVLEFLLGAVLIIVLIVVFKHYTANRIKAGWVKTVVDQEMSRSTIRCPYCGAFADQNSIYCSKCGKRQ